MKQTFTKESIELIKGEIFIKGKNGGSVYSTHPIIRSGIIDRKEFVKPVDVDTLASEASEKKHPYNEEPISNCAYDEGYMAGYNANPNEFTREQLIDAMKYASSHLSSIKGIMEYVDNISELSIPESVTIENNQVISVVWK